MKMKMNDKQIEAAIDQLLEFDQRHVYGDTDGYSWKARITNRREILELQVFDSSSKLVYHDKGYERVKKVPGKLTRKIRKQIWKGLFREGGLKA